MRKYDNSRPESTRMQRSPQKGSFSVGNERLQSLLSAAMEQSDDGPSIRAPQGGGGGSAGGPSGDSEHYSFYLIPEAW
jgi:hypothetical protein